MDMIRLPSGRWYRHIETDAQRREHLILADPTRPSDYMRIRLPFSWRSRDEDALAELARDPDLRLWTDEYGIQWRIAVVGPNSPYEFPVQARYLVFDSQDTWAGITRFGDRHLGDLGDEALRRLRDQTADLGGGRRSFRPPAEVPN